MTGHGMARLAQARAVMADIAHHPDDSVLMACAVIDAHSSDDREIRDARGIVDLIEGRAT